MKSYNVVYTGRVEFVQEKSIVTGITHDAVVVGIRYEPNRPGLEPLETGVTMTPREYDKIKHRIPN